MGTLSRYLDLGQSTSSWPETRSQNLGIPYECRKAGLSTTFRIFLCNCVNLMSKRRAGSTSPCVTLARDHYCVFQEQKILRSHHLEVFGSSLSSSAGGSGMLLMSEHEGLYSELVLYSAGCCEERPGSLVVL